MDIVDLDNSDVIDLVDRFAIDITPSSLLAGGNMDVDMPGSFNTTTMGLSFHLECQEGFIGDLCEFDSDATTPTSDGLPINTTSGGPLINATLNGASHPIDACTGVHCNNGGMCVLNPQIGISTCACQVGFTGEACEIEISDNNCGDIHCLNGVCVEGTESSACQCNPGHVGEFCNNTATEGDSAARDRGVRLAAGVAGSIVAVIVIVTIIVGGLILIRQNSRKCDSESSEGNKSFV